MELDGPIRESMRGLLPDHLGIVIERVTDTEVSGHLVVTSQLCISGRLLNKGRTLMLWQTEVSNADGKLVALVTQSQIIMTG